ncbi:hypothetical protein BH09BAC1_BH09BAC1_02360 [soil metagenome]
MHQFLAYLSIIYHRVPLLVLFILLAFSSYGQEEDSRKEKFKRFFKGSPTDPYKSRTLPVPLFSYSPETSFGFGISIQHLFRTPSTDSTGNLSILGLAFKYTLRKQFILNPYWDVFWKKQRYRLTGAVLWQRYPDSFFGLGNETSQNGERYTADYLMMRNRFARELVPKLQIGLQHRLEYMYNAKMNSSSHFDTLTVPGEDGYTASGIGLTMIFDTRDHNLFPFKGWYVILSHHTYSRFFGGNTDLTSLRLDARKYWNPGKGGHVIAAQVVVQVHSNVPPFKMMATFGAEELMRGYFYGRFRDQHMYAMQAEYRFPLFWRFLGVAFAGVGNTIGPYSSPGFNNLKFAGGGGIRFTLDAKERINVRFDAGFGLDGSKGFYLAIGEAF